MLHLGVHYCYMKEEKILRKVLEDNHSKVTKPRLTIFHLLLKQEPQSLAELVNRSHGKVNRVSVYRIIDLFERLGITRRVTIGWKYKVELSEIFSDHHHHISCLSCNKVVAVQESELVEQIINRLAGGTGFTVASHQLELQGYCPRCQKTNTPT